MEKYKKYEHCYSLMISILPVLGVGLYLNEYMGWEIPNTLLAIGILLLGGTIHIAYSLRKQPFLYIALVAVLLLTALILVWNREDLKGHIEMTRILLRILGLVFMAAASYIASRVYWFRVAMAAGFFIGAVIIGSQEWVFVKLAGVAVSMYCVMVLLETFLRIAQKEKGKRQKLAIQTLLPLYLIGVFVLLLVPVGETCFQWSLAREAVNKISQSYTSVRNYFLQKKDEEYGKFTVNMTGYSEDGSIGGSIMASGKEALELNASVPKVRTLYLIGNYKNSYRDNAWTDTISEQTYPIETKESVMDTLELMYSLFRYNRLAEFKQYVKENSLKITYGDIQTKSIFYMAKMKNIVYGSSEQGAAGGDVLRGFEKIAASGTFYDLDYYDINAESNAFRKFIRKEQEYCYTTTDKKKLVLFQALMNKNESLSSMAVPNDLEEELAKRRKFIYENYMQLEEGMRQQIHQLTETVTKDADGTYEKLLAIESYLKEFTYTTEPKEPANGEDIIYEFLFHTHKGYCTYFASAMVLMARSIGIPARYVQGYVVPADDRGWYTYQVREDQAHAWVQAYIDGVGWMSFEPTAGYKKDDGAGFLQDKTTGKPEMTKQPVIIQNQEDEQEQEEAPQAIGKWMFFVGTAAVLFIIVMICGIGGMIYKNKRLYRNTDETRQFYYEIVRMQWMMHKLGYDREPGETWNEYIGRIQEGVGDSLPLLLEVADSYLRIRYHEEVIRKKELQQCTLTNEGILNLLKRKMRWSHFLRIRLTLALLPIKNMEVKNSID